MKKITYITSIILLLGASSCSNDDFLDREPNFAFVESNVISNAETAKIAVNGIYSTLLGRFSGMNDEHYIDKASQSGFVDWSEAEFDMVFSESDQESRSIEDRWTALYRTVNASNLVINGILNLGEDGFESAEIRNSLLGEARFFRAWAHLNIFWGYGHWFSDDDSNPYGLVYREKLASVDNLQQARLNVGESYQKILEDLDFAITHLDNSLTNESGGFNNRFISKEFAKVIKAKLLLRRGGMNDNVDQLNESLALVNDVLNAPPAGFAMQEDLAQVYEDSWDSEENLFVGYLEGDGFEVPVVPYGANLAGEFGQEVDPDDPTPADELHAGLNFGASLFRADPRWPIVTGESYDGRGNGRFYTWTKVTRESEYYGYDIGDLKFNMYYFRFPELYLMKSELLARTGASIADAIAPINTMRSIRTNPILPSLNPTTQQELMDSIFLEYFFETFLENGNEFYASLRFKTSDGRPWIETTKDGKPLDMNQIPYNIPASEMFGNRLMIQNIDQD